MSRTPSAAVEDAVTWPLFRSPSSFHTERLGGSTSERRDAQLLAAVTLTWAAISLTAAVLCAFLLPAAAAPAVVPVVAVAMLSHMVAHVLARCGRVRGALVLHLGTLATTTTVVQTWSRPMDEATGLTVACWFGLSLLTGAMFLKPRGIAALGGVLALALSVSMGLVGASLHSIVHPAVVFLSIVAVTMVMRRHRDALEAIHHRELRSRNEELEILKGHLEERVAERTADLTASNAALAAAYKTLHSNQQALVIAEKMAAIGRLTAGIAHEMASPLAAVMASAHDLRSLIDEYGKSIDDPAVESADHREICAEMTAAARLVETGADRVATFVRSVRAQTRDDGRRSLQTFDCVAVTRDALLLVAHAARDANCKVVVDAPREGVELHGPLSRLAQVITNLAKNAIDATGENGGGELRIAVRDEGDRVAVEMVDDGPGIAPDAQLRVFEPLFTTKPYGKGTGLGLAIAKEIVEGDFGGKLQLTSIEGSGARFRIELPRKGANHGA